MTGIRVNGLRALTSGEYVWTEAGGLGGAATVTTSTGTQTVGEALDSRIVAYKPEFEPNFDPADAYPAIQSAVNKGNVYLSGDYILASGSVEVPSNRQIQFAPGATVTQPNKGAFNAFYCMPGSRNIDIFGRGKIIGPYPNGVPMWAGQLNSALVNGDTFATHLRENIGIHVRGRFWQREDLGLTPAQMMELTDESVGIRVREVEIYGFGQSGAVFDQCKDSFAIANHIHHCGRDGIRLYGVEDSFCLYNRIEDLSPGIDGAYPNWNVYGITATRVYGKTGYPDPDSTIGRPSKDVVIGGNTAKRCFTWKALDTHGGVRIKFINNKIYDSYIGIGIDSGGSSDSGTAPPIDCQLIGNSYVITSDAVYKRAAIAVFASGSINDGAAGFGDGTVISGETFRGYGGGNSDGVISVSNHRNLTIGTCNFKDFTRCAISLNRNVRYFNIHGNNFNNPKNYLTINVTNGGSGYTSKPDVLINGELRDDFKCVSYVNGGAVTLVSIIYLGNDWYTAPTVSFSGGGGTGATATASLFAPNTIIVGGDTIAGTIGPNTFSNFDEQITATGVLLSAPPNAVSGVKFDAANTFLGYWNKVVNPQHLIGGTASPDPIARLRINGSTGAVVNGYGATVNKVSTGVYDITVTNPPGTSANNLSADVSIMTSSDRISRATITAFDTVRVITSTTGLSAADSDFNVSIYSDVL